LFINICLTIDQHNNSLPYVPWLVDKKYTDEEIYEKFGFTEDEIKLIETTIKKYKWDSLFYKRQCLGPNSVSDEEVQKYIEDLENEKKIENYIVEELILEAIVSKVYDFKVKFDLTGHSNDRKSNRENQQYISNKEILYTLYKVAKQIKDDYDVEIIKENDKIVITDKSRNKNYHILATIYKDKTNSDFLVIKVITHIYQENFESNDARKIYITYINDNEIDKKYKLKNLI